MAKTPVAQKVRKVSSPKTLPKKLRATITKDAPEPSIRRGQLDLGAGTSIVSSICTPGRTTRSMARVLSNDMPPPITSRATPSKRRTVATPKSAAKTSLLESVLAPKEDASEEFARPLPPKPKQLNQSQTETAVDDSIDNVPMDNNLNVSRKSARGKRATKSTRKTATVTSADSSEDDLPSVSMLETNRTPGKFVRVNKSIFKETENSSENDLPSVSMLGTDEPAKKSIRSRKSMMFKTTTDDSTEDELPSVSMLGKSLIQSDEQSEQKTQSRRSKRTIDKIELNEEENAPIVESRMSMVQNEVVNEPNDEKSSSVKRSIGLTPKNKRNSSRHSTKKTPNTAVSSGIDNNAKAVGENQLNEEKPTKSESKKKSLNDAPAKSIDIPTIVVTQSETAKSDEMEEYVSAEDEVHDLPKPIKKKSIGKKNRVSVIDLTDSPMPSNNRSVLNKTFSPEKKEDNTEETDNKDKTFTEETGNTSAINDKTFSPLPNQSTAKKSAMKHVLLPPPAYSPMPLKLSRKSIGTKNTPQLKRLQVTPLKKPNSRSNFNTSNKLSSAKKTKMAQAAVDLIKQSQPPNSPKLFKFGEESKGHQFRFSMVSESLKPNNQTQKGKAVILKPVIKPAPNFGDMHNKMFKKAESIDETQKRHEKRAHLLLSGQKPTTAQRNADKSVVENVRKVKNDHKTRKEVETRRPLAHVNRSRLNDEERQERRRQLFKQGSKTAAKKDSDVHIKGVRLNRRFELMMKNRSTSK